jgi:hypothetical protein
MAKKSDIQVTIKKAPGKYKVTILEDSKPISEEWFVSKYAAMAKYRELSGNGVDGAIEQM